MNHAGTRAAAKNPLISSQDSLATEAEAFKDKPAEAGVQVTFRRFEGARNGFTRKGGEQADAAWQMMVDHLKRYVQAA